MARIDDDRAEVGLKIRYWVGSFIVRSATS